jgi:hypothetical protein
MPVAILPTPRGPSAFLYRDPEGAPSSAGARYHAAQDWFAKGGTPVRSPCDGRLVEVRYSGGDRYGQVFGGTVKVMEQGSERVFALRHVEPRPGMIPGRLVDAGDDLAAVTSWADRPTASHVHLEVWRSLTGGYRLANMVDPGLLTWTAEAPPPPVVRPSGASLRLALPGHQLRAGWGECLGMLRWIAAHGLADTNRGVLAWQGRRYEGGRRITGVARNFAERGFLS